MSALPPKADIDGHFLNVRVWPFTQVLHQSIVLSTTTTLPTELLSLSEIIFLYSSDPYQASAAAREGNSMITKRGWGHIVRKNQLSVFPTSSSAGATFRREIVEMSTS